MSWNALRRLGVFVAAMATWNPAQAAVLPGNLMLSVSPTYSAFMKVIGGSADIYQGPTVGLRLSQTLESTQLFVGARFGKLETNYSEIDDPVFNDMDFYAGFRSYVGGTHRAFMEFSGNAIQSSGIAQPGMSFGGSLGGGLLFMLGSHIGFGFTTLYTFASGPYQGMQRRQLNQSVDLSILF